MYIDPSTFIVCMIAPVLIGMLFTLVTLEMEPIIIGAAITFGVILPVAMTALIIGI